MKKCYKCKLDKSLEDFIRESKKIDGRSSICKPCKKIISDEYAHREDVLIKRHAQYIKKRYGLKMGEVEVMKKQQQYKCLICRQVKELVIDHNHETNVVRGLLCGLCNQGLGFFNDNGDYLKGAIKYLRNNYESIN